MKILSTEINGNIYCYIDEYDLSFGKIYKFANREKRIFCEKLRGKFIEIADKDKLKEIEEYFKVETDVIF